MGVVKCVRADVAVLRSQLARVRHARCLVENYVQVRREEPARRHDFDNDETTTTMEVS